MSDTEAPILMFTKEFYDLHAQIADCRQGVLDAARAFRDAVTYEMGPITITEREKALCEAVDNLDQVNPQ